MRGDEERREDLNAVRDPYDDGRGAPNRRGPSAAAVIVAGLLAVPFILGGLYVSAMLLIGGAMSATGVSTAGGILMLAAPVPAIVGILVAVKVYRGAARPR